MKLLDSQDSFLCLPKEHTAGFAVDTDHQLLQAMEIEGCPEWKKCIVLLIDEMHVKADLYDKISDTFIIIDVCTVPLLNLYLIRCTFGLHISWRH